VVSRAARDHLGEGEAVTGAELRREAGVMKLRAMRLRSFGDENDQWDAIVLLRRAAMNELAAIAATPDMSGPELASARVEACGLFLEARDPVRASELWQRLPRWLGTSDAGAGMMERLQPLYQPASERFLADWSGLRTEADRTPVPEQISEQRLRALLERYPGVPELWWALSLRAADAAASDAGAAALARDRMKQLDPALEQDALARKRWDEIERAFVRMVTIEMRPERPGSLLQLEAVARIAAVFEDLFSGFIEGTFGSEVLFMPQGARAGSFILDVAAWGMPPHAIEEFDRKLTEAPEQVGVQRLIRLVTLLEQAGVRLTVSSEPGPGSDRDSTSGPTTVVIDVERCRLLYELARQASATTLDSRDVPQANDLARVFRIAEMVEKHEEITPDALGEISRRQVDYYRRAAKILGLLTESGDITAAGRLIARLDEPERLRAAVVYFESSVCGDAWIRWSQGKTLLDVNPDTAFEFLQQSVPGLNQVTAERRAQTLMAWHGALIGAHYAAGERAPGA
jgi:hypothetical protein